MNYQPYHTSHVHRGQLRTLASTWKHVVSGGDDGKFILHELTTLTRIRSVDVVSWSMYRGLLDIPPLVPRRIKYIHILENFKDGGTMCVGTSVGEVAICSIGSNV